MVVMQRPTDSEPQARCRSGTASGALDTQPHYPDGTYAWAVDAVRPGGKQRPIATTYVRAPTATRAADAGEVRLRSILRSIGHTGGWRVSARPAHAVHDLHMVPIR